MSKDAHTHKSTQNTHTHTHTHTHTQHTGLAGSPWQVLVETAQWHVEGHINQVGRPMQNLARLCLRAEEQEVDACKARQSSVSFGAVAARGVDGDSSVTFSALSCFSTGKS